MDFRDEGLECEKINTSVYKVIASISMSELRLEEPIISFSEPTIQKVDNSHNSYFETVLSRSKELKGIPRYSISCSNQIENIDKSFIKGMAVREDDKNTKDKSLMYDMGDVIQRGEDNSIVISLEVPKTIKMEGKNMLPIKKENGFLTFMNTQVNIGFLDYKISLGFLDTEVDLSTTVDLGILDTPINLNEPLNLGVLDTNIDLGVLDTEINIVDGIKKFCEIKV